MFSVEQSLDGGVDGADFNECVTAFGAGAGWDDTKPRFFGAGARCVKHSLHELFGTDDIYRIGFSDEARIFPA
jgi:hypothetical protein